MHPFKDLIIAALFIITTNFKETIWMPLNKWTDVQIVAYPYERIPLKNKKEQITGIQTNAGESQKHYAQWKKSTQNSESF